ncbi:MAG: beta-galactosidase [Tepidisphaeraceae bacterium]
MGKAFFRVPQVGVLADLWRFHSPAQVSEYRDLWHPSNPINHPFLFNLRHDVIVDGGVNRDNSAARVTLPAMPTPHSLDCSAPPPFSNLEPFVFGTATNPAGVTLTADGVSFLEDGGRVIPVMGEFHFARYPQTEWRDAILKMKAGGITVVATYVFWIFHEERRGEFDWAGDRDLATFVKTVHDCGLRCVVRVGPWCHGEVRNGGLPEWLFDRGIAVPRK